VKGRAEKGDSGTGNGEWRMVNQERRQTFLVVKSLVFFVQLTKRDKGDPDSNSDYDYDLDSDSDPDPDPDPSQKLKPKKPRGENYYMAHKIFEQVYKCRVILLQLKPRRRS